MTKLLVKPTLFGPRCGFRGQDVSLTPPPHHWARGHSEQNLGHQFSLWGQFCKCGLQPGSFSITTLLWELQILRHTSDLLNHKLWGGTQQPGFRQLEFQEPLAFGIQPLNSTLGYRFVFIGGFTLYDTKEQG